MATSLPPHNLTEIASALTALLKNPDISHEELLEHVTGPDFPTGGVIMGRSGIETAYRYGRGLISVRGKYTVEEKRGRRSIVFTEIPYQVTVQSIIESVIDAVKNDKIDTISDVINETNHRVGLRLVIELKKSVVDETVTVNQLFKYTPLQSTFSIINLVLDGGQPKTLNLKQLLEAYRNHRVEIIHRRTRYLLRKAEERLHILEGLRVALANIDEVVEIIKSSRSVADARAALQSRFELSEIQARAILDMRLARLTSLEIEKIEEEYNALLEEIAGYKALLADINLVYKLIKEDLAEIVSKYGDGRRTEISDEEIDTRINIEDLIEEELMAVTYSHQGYIKRVALDKYRSQGRGGTGVNAGDVKDGDFLENLFIAGTHDYLMFFSNKGRAYWRKVYELPELSRTARGRAIANIVEVQEDDERILEIVRVDQFDDDRYLLVATANGYVKKTVLSAYSRPRAGGIRAMGIDEDDSLIGVRLLSDHQSVMLSTRNGQAINFDEADARPMGRTARGVRGIKLRPGDQVVSLVVADEDQDILTICEKGYGKRTELGEYRQQGRGGMGKISIRTTERNGQVVSVLAVRPEDEIMLVTQHGMIVRVSAGGISRMGRATQGVRVMRLKGDDRVVSCARVPDEEEEPEADES